MGATLFVAWIPLQPAASSGISARSAAELVRLNFRFTVIVRNIEATSILATTISCWEGRFSPSASFQERLGMAPGLVALSS